MAIHETPASMLKESLDETLEAARFCIEYEKTDERWGSYATKGCLGFPGAILLFSIIDTIGSYFRKNNEFLIKVDDTLTPINKDGWEHFKILNSKYFGQNLSSEFIQQLYVMFRSYLTHNSILGKSSLMVPNNSSFGDTVKHQAFIEEVNNEGDPVYIISLAELWELCRLAIDTFKRDIDNVVPSSKQGMDFH
jgi:hypothetical protein